MSPNLTKKFQWEMSQIAKKKFPCAMLLGGLSVNLNHLKTLKCKLCSGGCTLAYHGNTTVMKSHLEAKHAVEYKKLIGGLLLSLKYNV